MSTSTNNILPALLVKVAIDEEANTEFRFTEPFHVGRDSACQLKINHPAVSRFHLKILHENNLWFIQDLDSTNGTHVDDERVRRLQVKYNEKDPVQIVMGQNGPKLTFIVQQPETKSIETDLDSSDGLSAYVNRYSGDVDSEEIGLQTRMVRLAFQHKQLRRSKHLSQVGIILLIIILSSLAYFAYTSL